MLRGMGAAALASPFLPWLRAHGEDATETGRLILFFTPHGTIHDNWRPTGTERDFTLGPILAPLAGFEDRLMILDGMNVDASISVGAPHTKGPALLWTAAPLIEDEERWATYVRDALIETTVSRDILLLLRIDKPALLRRLFGLGCAYPGRILSYNKMLGQLHDAGNTTTLARPDTTTALARARTASIGGVSSSRPSAPICFGPPRAPLPRSPGGETGTTRSTSCSAKARASSR